MHLPNIHKHNMLVRVEARFFRIAIVNLITTPRFGIWADRIGARKARAILSGFQLFGATLLLFMGYDLWLLMIPILITNIFGPVMDVTSRMTFLNEAPDIRTRLMTIYIVFMFVGGGLASWIGTSAYDLWGWTGTACLAIAMTSCSLLLSLLAVRLYSE